MHEAYRQSLARKIELAIPKADRAMKTDMGDLLLQAALANREVSVEQIREIAAGGHDAVQRALGEMSQAADPFPPALREQLRQAELARKPEAIPPLLRENDRVYYQLDAAAESERMPAVRDRLAEKGYTITDYAGGYATDGKQKFKIGRLLQDEKDLLRSYETDPARTGTSKLMVVLSSRPDDINRMSTNRGWYSCMNACNGIMSDSLPAHVEHGTVIAYLTSKDDPDVRNPLSRILLNPYDHPEHGRVWKPNVNYGLPNTLFETQVAQIADGINAGKPIGTYTAPQEVYTDKMSHTKVNMPSDSSALPVTAMLDGMKVPYTIEGGDITVHGTVDLSGSRVRKMPDFSNVVFKEGFTVDAGYTVDDGSPKRIGLTPEEAAVRKQINTFTEKMVSWGDGEQAAIDMVRKGEIDPRGEHSRPLLLAVMDGKKELFIELMAHGADPAEIFNNPGLGPMSLQYKGDPQFTDWPAEYHRRVAAGEIKPHAPEPVAKPPAREPDAYARAETAKPVKPDATPEVKPAGSANAKLGHAQGAAQVAVALAAGNYGQAVTSAGMELALEPKTYTAAAKLTAAVKPVAKALGMIGKRLPVIGAVVTGGFVLWEVGSYALKGEFGKAAAATAAGAAEAAGNIVGFGLGDAARETVRGGVIAVAGDEYAVDKSGLRQLGEGAYEVGSKFVKGTSAEVKPENATVTVAAATTATTKQPKPPVR